MFKISFNTKTGAFSITDESNMRDGTRRLKGKSLLYFPNNYVILDIETTGLDPGVDEIIEIAALKVADNKIIDTFQSFVKPKSSISEFITGLTGITNEMVVSAPSIEEILPSFLSFVGDAILIGHNINFDINFLYDCIYAHFEKYFQNDFVDTLRLARKYIKDAPNYKLTTLKNFLHLDSSDAHRALSDCKTTYQLLQHIKELQSKESELLMQRIANITCTEFENKRIFELGVLEAVSHETFQAMCRKCNAELTEAFYKDVNYLIFGYRTYSKYKRGDFSQKMVKANRLSTTGLVILSEYEFYEKLGLSDIFSRSHKYRHKYCHHNLSAKDLTTEKVEFDTSHPLYGKVCVFTGVLDKMPRREAMQAVLDFGGQCGNSVTNKTNYLILGNNDYCKSIKDGKSTKHKRAEELKLKGNDIEIISENVFYDMIDEP